MRLVGEDGGGLLVSVGHVLKASLLANEPSLIILGDDGRVFRAPVCLPVSGSGYF